MTAPNSRSGVVITTHFCNWTPYFWPEHPRLGRSLGQTRRPCSPHQLFHKPPTAAAFYSTVDDQRLGKASPSLIRKRPHPTI
jgi:hypothetical protein